LISSVILVGTVNQRI